MGCIAEDFTKNHASKSVRGMVGRRRKDEVRVCVFRK